MKGVIHISYTAPLEKHPLGQLPVEDLDMIVRFILASGSLKTLAAELDVSYPTIRTRLDRLIDKLQHIVEEREPDPFIEELADMVGTGQILLVSAKRLKSLYLEKIEALKEET